MQTSYFSPVPFVGESLILFAEPAVTDCDWLNVFYKRLIDYILFIVNALCNFTSKIKISINP